MRLYQGSESITERVPRSFQIKQPGETRRFFFRNFVEPEPSGSVDVNIICQIKGWIGRRHFSPTAHLAAGDVGPSIDGAVVGLWFAIACQRAGRYQDA
jgi:hypothetical protein